MVIDFFLHQLFLQVDGGAAGHAGGINCLDVSPDGRFLAAVGLNNHSKQLVILWSIAGLVDGQKVTMIVPERSVLLLTLCAPAQLEWSQPQQCWISALSSAFAFSFARPCEVL